MMLVENIFEVLKGESGFKKICFSLLICKFIQQGTPKSNQIIFSVGGCWGVNTSFFSPCVAVVLMCSPESVFTQNYTDTTKGQSHTQRIVVLRHGTDSSLHTHEWTHRRFHYVKESLWMFHCQIFTCIKALVLTVWQHYVPFLKVYIWTPLRYQWCLPITDA